MSSPVLRSLISSRVDDLFAEMAGVRDGLADSIHEARVACRRLRELLPLVGHDRRIDHARHIVRDAGRALGVVRDLDVMAALIVRYEEAVPTAIATIALARHTLRRRREQAARGMVKALESVDLSDVDALRSSSPFDSLVRAVGLPAGQWTRRLRTRLDERARIAAAAVEHAAGLSFPNRLHHTRIAMRKLRYLVEIAEAARLSVPPHVVDDLKKMQARLGDIHDRHVLSSELRELAGDTAPDEQVAALRSVIDADAARLHRRYVEQRDRLLGAIDACRRVATRADVLKRQAVVVSVVSAVVAPSAWLFMRMARGEPMTPAEYRLNVDEMQERPRRKA